VRDGAGAIDGPRQTGSGAVEFRQRAAARERAPGGPPRPIEGSTAAYRIRIAWRTAVKGPRVGLATLAVFVPIGLRVPGGPPGIAAAPTRSAEVKR
jgi:hypothetical protein